MKKSIYILLIGLLSLSGFTSSSNANGVRDTRSMFKAVYISSFTSLIDWPLDYRKGKFIIEVYDKNEALFELLTKRSAGKAIGSQEIKIVKYNPAKKIKSHIIYVSKEYSHKLGIIETSIQNKSTLLISDKPGDLKRGATINFIINKANNNKLAFELNKENAKKHNLILATKLGTLALNVK